MSVNKVTLIGNLGADPEMRHTTGGTAVTTVNLATSDRWRDKQSGEMQERTEWHRVVFFARLAEVVNEHLRKGSKIYVAGRNQTRKWQDKAGIDRWTTEVVANEMQMLDGRPAGGGSSQGGSNSQQGANSAQQSAPPVDPGFGDLDDDDVPF